MSQLQSSKLSAWGSIGTVWIYASHGQDHHYLATAFGPRPECSCSSELHLIMH
jgi:hypothetical protein